LRNRTLFFISVSALLLLTNYTIIDLPTPAGTANSQAYGVNNYGDVAGRAEIGSMGYPVVWLGGSTAQIISTGAMCLQQAEEISDSGYVVGTAWTTPPGSPCGGFATPNGFFWKPGMSSATMFGSGAHSVNDSSNIAGELYDGYAVEATTWPSVGGSPSYLTWYGGAARSIDSVPVVAGDMRLKGGPSHAFLWINGWMQDLGTLGGSWSVAYRSVALSWPDPAGYSVFTVGAADLPSTPSGIVTHAFVHNAGPLFDLGTLPGDLNSVAYGVNRSKTIVGASTSATGTSRAFIVKGGVMYDLNTLIPKSDWFLTSARDISDSGYIVGEGIHGGVRRAYLLVP
jgi:probable HAF family extracellular repeat protein